MLARPGGFVANVWQLHLPPRAAGHLIGARHERARAHGTMPGGIEAMFAEQAAHIAPTEGQHDPEVMDEIGRRYGPRAWGPTPSRGAPLEGPAARAPRAAFSSGSW